MKNFEKGFGIVPIVIIVAVILIAVLGYFRLVKNSSQPQVSQPSPTEYKNTQYGFSFALPESWKGYSIVTGNWEGFLIDTPSDSELGPMISIRHPLWTAESKRQDIPIMIFTLTQWDALQQNKFHIGAAPINPSELGRNSTYVFALPARYNFAFPTGFEEVESILQTKPLNAF